MFSRVPVGLFLFQLDFGRIASRQNSWKGRMDVHGRYELAFAKLGVM